MIALRHASDAQVRSALSKHRRAHTPLVDEVVRALPAYSSLDDIVRAIGNMGRLSHPCTLIPEYSAAPVVPTDFANLFAWWRADLGVTTVSGGFVTAWADQSGNANHLSQGNSLARPKLITSSANFNAKASLDYNGDGGYFGLHWLERTFSTSLVSPTTVYVVLRGTSGNTGGYAIGTSTTDGARQDVFQSNSKVGILTSAGTNIQAATTATVLDTTRVICAVFAGSGSKIYMRSTSVPEASGTLGASTVTQIRIGMYAGQLDSWKGEIADVAIYAANHDGTSTIQSLMQGYHSPRYGLTVT